MPLGFSGGSKQRRPHSIRSRAVGLMQTLLQGAHGYDATQHRTEYADNLTRPTTLHPIGQNSGVVMTETEK